MLNPSKPEDYDPNLTEADIFNSHGITEEEYYNALSISLDSDYDLHLKDVRANCYCASLLRTQIHVPRRA